MYTNYAVTRDWVKKVTADGGATVLSCADHHNILISGAQKIPVVCPLCKLLFAIFDKREVILGVDKRSIYRNMKSRLRFRCFTLTHFDGVYERCDREFYATSQQLQYDHSSLTSPNHHIHNNELLEKTVCSLETYYTMRFDDPFVVKVDGYNRALNIAFVCKRKDVNRTVSAARVTCVEMGVELLEVNELTHDKLGLPYLPELGKKGLPHIGDFD